MSEEKQMYQLEVVIIMGPEGEQVSVNGIVGIQTPLQAMQVLLRAQSQVAQKIGEDLEGQEEEKKPLIHLPFEIHP